MNTKKRKSRTGVPLRDHMSLIETPMKKWTSAQARLFDRIQTEPALAREHLDTLITTDTAVQSVYGRARTRKITDPEEQAVIAIVMLSALLREFRSGA